MFTQGRRGFVCLKLTDLDQGDEAFSRRLKAVVTAADLNPPHPAAVLLVQIHIMSIVFSHHHRQFMQYLSPEAWVKATTLPESRKAVATLLENGWIEAQGSGGDLSYRIKMNLAGSRKLVRGSFRTPLRSGVR